MKRTYHAVLIAVLGSCGAVIAGCSTTSSLDQESRRYERMDYQARFRDFRSACLKQGGLVFIDARKRPLRPGMPEPGDRYYCQSGRR